MRFNLKQQKPTQHAFSYLKKNIRHEWVECNDSVLKATTKLEAEAQLSYARAIKQHLDVVAAD